MSDETEAVVVGSVDIGESSRIIKLISERHGRHDVIASGARTSARKFAGMLDPGCRIAVTYKPRVKNLPVIGTIDLVKAPRRAREDIERLGLLSYGCELCAAFAPEHDEAAKLYGLLGAWLDRLEAETSPTLGTRLALEVKVLTFAGLTPALLRCARCGEGLVDPIAFEPSAGGALHTRCGPGVPIVYADARRIEVLRRTPLADVDDGPPAFRWLLSDFAQWHLGKPLRSRAFLETLAADAERD